MQDLVKEKLHTSTCCSPKEPEATRKSSSKGSGLVLALVGIAGAIYAATRSEQPLEAVEPEWMKILKPKYDLETGFTTICINNETQKYLKIAYNKENNKVSADCNLYKIPCWHLLENAESLYNLSISQEGPGEKEKAVLGDMIAFYTTEEDLCDT